MLVRKLRKENLYRVLGRLETGAVTLKITLELSQLKTELPHNSSVPFLGI